MHVNEYHHDVISTYDTYVSCIDYDVRVVSDDQSSEEPIYWIDVTDVSTRTGNQVSQIHRNTLTLSTSISYLNNQI